MKRNRKIFMRRMPLILCSMIWMLISASCAGKKDSLIVRENPGPGADSYGETFGPDEVDDGSGGTNKAGSNGADSLAERLQVPELYEKSIQSEDGTFQLTCNAETVVPDVSQIPIYKVRPKEIDGEWIDCITEAFFGSYPVYDGASYLPDPEIYGSDVENPMKKKEIHPWLEDPDNLPETSEYYSHYFYGIVEMEEDLFSYKLERTTNNSLEAEIVRKKPEALNAVLYWDSGYYASEETTTYPRPSKEEAERLAGITPEQAQEMAKEYLKKLKLDDFSPQYTCLGVCYYFDESGISMNHAKFIDAGYLVSCTRKVGEIPITEEAKVGNWSETGLDDISISKWAYEKVQFFVNQEGLQEARLYNLYRMEEQQAASTELLGFPEVADLFERAMQMNYKDTDALHTDIRIERVQLGYMRTYNAGVDSTNGVLIPVWDFFGSTECVGSKTQEEWKDQVFKRAEPNNSLLTINACDGSIIDRQIGY